MLHARGNAKHLELQDESPEQVLAAYQADLAQGPREHRPLALGPNFPAPLAGPDRMGARVPGRAVGHQRNQRRHLQTRHDLLACHPTGALRPVHRLARSVPEPRKPGPMPTHRTSRVIRTDAAMSTTRFCQTIDMPERTWRRWQAKACAGQQPKGPWPRPARTAAVELARKHALAHPAWGHRKVWAMVRHDGHIVSEATILRLPRGEG